MGNQIKPEAMIGRRVVPYKKILGDNMYKDTIWYIYAYDGKFTLSSVEGTIIENVTRSSFRLHKLLKPKKK